MRVIVLPSSERQVGFTVAKKNRLAHQRNRLKRLLREIYRKHKAVFGTNIIILHAKSSDDITIDDFVEDFFSILEKMKRDDTKNRHQNN